MIIVLMFYVLYIDTSVLKFKYEMNSFENTLSEIKIRIRRYYARRKTSTHVLYSFVNCYRDKNGPQNIFYINQQIII